MAAETTVMKVKAKSTQPALLAQFVRTVRQHQLFISGHHVLVAVSGGPDSIALLSLLHRLAPSWRLTLTVVHCNYGLRGEESDADESFVRTFCGERQLNLVVHRPSLAKRRQRSSLQAAAREARYDFMKQLACEREADRIAVGHTANDQAETVLMWFLRGAGMTGLTGMSYAREDGIIRPLLAASRKEVEAYLHHEGLTYRRDSSNEQTLYHRNRIRKELFPVLTQLAPAAVRVLRRQADLLREDEHFLESVTGALVSALVIRESHDVQRVDHRAFTELPVALQRRLARAILRTYDEEGRASSLAVVESVRRVFSKEKNGTQLVLKQVVVTLNHGVVRFCPAGRDRSNPIDEDQNKREGCTVSVPSMVSWAGTNQEIHVQHMPRCTVDQLGRLPTQGMALFDADRFSEPLVVRAWQAGDRFFPCGMNGKSKKLQDFFTDKKVSRHGRGKVPLLVAPEGILWVVGMRQDERFVVRSGTTQCLVVSVQNRARERE